jgi:hypothetical protein
MKILEVIRLNPFLLQPIEQQLQSVEYNNELNKIVL